jgi:hypothetical protein
MTKIGTWDRWDWIGAGIAALLIAMWVAHIVLPPAPPLDDDPSLGAPGLAAPGIGSPALGGPPPAFVR